MTSEPFVIVDYMGWRIRREGWQSRRYHTQADAFRVARELAASAPERPQVLLRHEDGTFTPIPNQINGHRVLPASGVSPLEPYLDKVRHCIALTSARVKKQNALLSQIDDRHPEAAVGRTLLSAMERRLHLLSSHLQIVEPIARKLQRHQYHCGTKLRPIRAKEPGFIATKNGEERAIIRRVGPHWFLHQSAPPTLHDITDYAGFEMPAIAVVVDMYLEGILPGPSLAENTIET